MIRSLVRPNGYLQKRNPLLDLPNTGITIVKQPKFSNQNWREGIFLRDIPHSTIEVREVDIPTTSNLITGHPSVPFIIKLINIFYIYKNGKEASPRTIEKEFDRYIASIAQVCESKGGTIKINKTQKYRKKRYRTVRKSRKRQTIKKYTGGINWKLIITSAMALFSTLTLVDSQISRYTEETEKFYEGQQATANLIKNPFKLADNTSTIDVAARSQVNSMGTCGTDATYGSYLEDSNHHLESRQHAYDVFNKTRSSDVFHPGHLSYVATHTNQNIYFATLTLPHKSEITYTKQIVKDAMDIVHDHLFLLRANSNIPKGHVMYFMFSLPGHAMTGVLFPHGIMVLFHRDNLFLSLTGEARYDSNNKFYAQWRLPRLELGESYSPEIVEEYRELLEHMNDLTQWTTGGFGPENPYNHDGSPRNTLDEAIYDQIIEYYSKESLRFTIAGNYDAGVKSMPKNTKSFGTWSSFGNHGNPHTYRLDRDTSYDYEQLTKASNSDGRQVDLFIDPKLKMSTTSPVPGLRTDGAFRVFNPKPVTNPRYGENTNRTRLEQAIAKTNTPHGPVKYPGKLGPNKEIAERIQNPQLPNFRDSDLKIGSTYELYGDILGELKEKRKVPLYPGSLSLKDVFVFEKIDENGNTIETLIDNNKKMDKKYVLIPPPPPPPPSQPSYYDRFYSLFLWDYKPTEIPYL